MASVKCGDSDSLYTLRLTIKSGSSVDSLGRGTANVHAAHTFPYPVSVFMDFIRWKFDRRGYVELGVGVSTSSRRLPRSLRSSSEEWL